MIQQRRYTAYLRVKASPNHLSSDFVPNWHAAKTFEYATAVASFFWPRWIHSSMPKFGLIAPLTELNLHRRRFLHRWNFLKSYCQYFDFITLPLRQQRSLTQKKASSKTTFPHGQSEVHCVSAFVWHYVRLYGTLPPIRNIRRPRASPWDSREHNRADKKELARGRNCTEPRSGVPPYAIFHSSSRVRNSARRLRFFYHHTILSPAVRCVLFPDISFAFLLLVHLLPVPSSSIKESSCRSPESMNASLRSVCLTGVNYF